MTSEHLSPLTIGTWITVVLLTTEVFLLSKYFHSKARKSDRFVLKLGLLVNLLADLTGTAACCAATYLYTVSYWGVPEEIAQIKWPIYVVVFTTGVVTAISQLFMVIRYWTLTQYHIVFAFMLLVLLGSVAGIFGSGALMIISPDEQADSLLTIFLYLAVVASSVGTGLTCILLFARKKVEKSDYLAAQTSFLRRFISGFIETGAVTTVATVTGSATTFGAARESRVWIACAFIVARVYACTMLYILCMRPEQAADVGNLPTASQPSTMAERHAASTSCTDPTSVMEGSDAFRLTRKRIQLHHSVDSDSSSDLSRHLNDELRDMEKRSESSASSYDEEGEREDGEDSNYNEDDEQAEEDARRPDTPSEYAESAARTSYFSGSTPMFVTPAQTPRI
ncbi:hypothetical protein C8F01DRAFT_1251143 [Mycena amicta]|nr:hypothetical protein C8F01DRAFT_1251143 [Mycena amicta]